MTFRFVIARALLVGLAVGVLVGAYMVGVVEPVIDEAIELEERMAHADSGGETADHEHGDEALFSRSQQVVGGVVAAVLYSVVAAGVFGTVYAAIRHRLPGRTELGKVMWLALVAFGALALLPAVKYPANPPGVGDPDTVGTRTALYVGLIACGILAAWVLTRGSGWLRSRVSDGARVTVLAAAGIVVAGVVLAALPGTEPIDPAVPADLVWRFRIRSIGTLALLWTGIGVGLGWALEHGRSAASPAGGVHRVGR